MPSTAVKMIAVHYSNRSGRSKAAQFVTEETAQAMVDARLAIWKKGANYINLTKSQPAMTPVARSLKPGISVMDGYCMGDERDVAIIEAWRFKQAA